MKKILLLSAICLLLRASSSFGVIYPKLTVIEKDTVVLITIGQMNEINVVFERVSFLEKKDKRNAEIITNLRKVDKKKHDQIRDLRRVVVLKDSIIASGVKQSEVFNDQLKYYQQKNGWLGVGRFVCFSLAVFFTGAYLIK